MTKTEKKEILNSYKLVCKGYEWAWNRYIEFKYKIEAARSTKIDGMPKGTKTIQLDDLVIQMTEYYEDYKKVLKNFLETRKKIETAINGVEDEKLKELLLLKYIDCKTWEEVSEEMRYSNQHIYELHNKALKIIKFKHPIETEDIDMI